MAVMPAQKKNVKTHLRWHKENLWGAKVNEVKEKANHKTKKTYSQKDEKIFPLEKQIMAYKGLILGPLLE